MECLCANDDEAWRKWRSLIEKESIFLKKVCKKVLTKRRSSDIMVKLTRESTAPNLENDTETTTQRGKTVIPNELDLSQETDESIKD